MRKVLLTEEEYSRLKHIRDEKDIREDWDDMLDMLKKQMLSGNASSEDAFDYIVALHNLLKINNISPKDAPDGTLDAWWMKD